MQKKRKKTNSEKKKDSELEIQILHNLVHLQKIHTNLAEKFDKLSKEISNLLSLFELTARSFAKNSNIKLNESDKDFLDKIDKLLEQNKTIAKSLTIMEDKIRENIHPQQNKFIPQEHYPENSYNPQIANSKRQIPKF